MSAWVYAKPKTSIKLPPTCAHTHTYIHTLSRAGAGKPAELAGARA